MKMEKNTNKENAQFEDKMTTEELELFEKMPHELQAEYFKAIIHRIKQADQLTDQVGQLNFQVERLMHEEKSGLLRSFLYFEIMANYIKKQSEEDLLDESKTPLYITAYDLAYLSY